MECGSVVDRSEPVDQERAHFPGLLKDRHRNADDGQLRRRQLQNSVENTGQLVVICLPVGCEAMFLDSLPCPH
jgi:hypothetical protein